MKIVTQKALNFIIILASEKTDIRIFTLVDERAFVQLTIAILVKLAMIMITLGLSQVKGEARNEIRRSDIMKREE